MNCKRMLIYRASHLFASPFNLISLLIQSLFFCLLIIFPLYYIQRMRIFLVFFLLNVKNYLVFIIKLFIF